MGLVRSDPRAYTTRVRLDYQSKVPPQMHGCVFVGRRRLHRPSPHVFWNIPSCFRDEQSALQHPSAPIMGDNQPLYKMTLKWKYWFEASIFHQAAIASRACVALLRDRAARGLKPVVWRVSHACARVCVRHIRRVCGTCVCVCEITADVFNAASVQKDESLHYQFSLKVLILHIKPHITPSPYWLNPVNPF